MIKSDGRIEKKKIIKLDYDQKCIFQREVYCYIWHQLNENMLKDYQTDITWIKWTKYVK